MFLLKKLTAGTVCEHKSTNSPGSTYFIFIFIPTPDIGKKPKKSVKQIKKKVWPYHVIETAHINEIAK